MGPAGSTDRRGHGRADGDDGRRNRRAAVGFRSVQVRVPVGRAHRVRLRPATGSSTWRSGSPDGRVVDLDVPYTSFGSIQAAGDRVVFVGASLTTEPAVVSVTVDADGSVTATEVLRPPRDLGLADGVVLACPSRSRSRPAAGAPPTLLFYPPTNPDVTAEPGELPPLLVLIHGGPTSAARPMLQLGTQYWTSRGFAVVDVNYGGSTGYGRGLPQPAPRPVGRRRRRRLRGGGPVARRAGPRRSDAALHPRRLRGRLHDAGRPRLPRHVRRRRQPLRRGRPRGARHRDPQVREPLPRRPDRPVPRRAATSTSNGRRSTTSTASTAR